MRDGREDRASRAEQDGHAHAPDPVRKFAHSHVHLNELVLELGQLARSRVDRGRGSSRIRRRLVVCAAKLRDDLLGHFADEEEGLFPFVSRYLPERSAVVERLQSAHDTICGSLVRLAHLVAHDKDVFGSGHGALLGHYGRFVEAYAAHAKEEAAFLEGLAEGLDSTQRTALAGILRGL